MKDHFLDANVLLYAFGEPHPLRESCRQLIRLPAEQVARLHVSTEAVQEFLHHRLRRVDRTRAVHEARQVVGFCLAHPFDAAVLERSLDLVAATSVRGRDAVHAATALEHGFTAIVSTDHDFDEIPGLTRVDPADVTG